jgi:hypothetical protein
MRGHGTKGKKRKRNTHAEGRELQPQDEDGLEGKIPGEVIEDGAESEALKEVEKAKDDPVGEPLDVILGRGRLDGFEGEIRGEGPADEIGDERGEGVDKVEKDEERGGANNGVRFGDLGALLERVEDRIFRQLESCASSATGEDRKHREKGHTSLSSWLT